MVRHGEAVRAGELLEPRPELALSQLDHLVALATGQMMMVIVAAKPVAGLAPPVHEHVDNPLAAEQPQRPVDSCEARLLASRAQ
jgi:hypothetical protein